jgi:shikimate kinase
MQKAILIGPPGSGKSTVGKAIARELGIGFVDTDSLIVEEQGKSIAEIFATAGESGFRAIERLTVLKALQSDVGVISLGGGSILDEEVQSALATSPAQVIYLKVGLSNVLSRMGSKGERPLVADDPKSQWLKILQDRAPIYRKLATAEVNTDNKKSHEVAREIIALMGLNHA